MNISRLLRTYTNSIRSPFLTTVSGVAVFPLIVVTPDSRAYFYVTDAMIINRRMTWDRTHVVFDAAISEFSGDDLQDLSAEPPFLCHGGVWIPIWRHFFETALLGCWDDDLRRLTLSEGGRHGSGDKTREDVSKLVA